MLVDKRLFVLCCFVMLMGVFGCNTPFFAGSLAGEESFPLTKATRLEAGTDLPARTDTPSPTATNTSLPPTSVPTITPTPVPAPPLFPIPGIEVGPKSLSGGIDSIAQSGAYWVRRNALLWSEVEPEQGARNWEALADLEQELILAADAGLQVVLIVRSTPAWAQAAPGYLCGPVLSDKLPAFASLMHDLVARYSQPPYHVKYWEIANEPDVELGAVPSESVFGCWGDSELEFYGGSYYADMLKEVYPQVKAADSQAQVMIGGLMLFCGPVDLPATSPGEENIESCANGRYLEGVLENGGGDFFDGVSFHSYDFYYRLGRYGDDRWHSQSDVTGPVLIAKARYLREVLDGYGYSKKYLMNTETGLLCGNDGREPKCLTEDYQLTKAYYVAQANVSALAEGLSSNIWYSLLGWRGSGLVDRKLQPYPAYSAFRFSAQQLQGAAFVRELTEFLGVKGYELSRNGQRIWVLWSLDGVERFLQYEHQPEAAYDVFGSLLEPGPAVIITVAPIYIIWAS